MTSNLPFGLKVKPARRYVPHHSIAYMVSHGKLFCKITYTTKVAKNPLYTFEVKSKEQLDRLSKANSINEILRLTEVVN